MNWLPKVLELIRESARIVFWFFLASAALLFLPSSWLARLRLEYVVETFGWVVGLVLLASGAVLATNLLAWLVAAGKRQSARSRHRRMIRERLEQLDPFEKAVLREFEIQASHSIRLPIENATVSGLLQAGILELVNRLGDFSLLGMLATVRKSPTAQQYLTLAHIDWPGEELGEVETEWLHATRPSFAAELERRRRLMEGF